jgi:Leucine-rich repeat (LRR) protein
MKKNTITLKNEEAWIIDGLEQNCITILKFENEINNEVKLLYIAIPENSSIELTSKINAPNLTMLMLVGLGSQNFMNDFHAHFHHAPDLTNIELVSTKISELPDFILKSRNLEQLSLRSETIGETPPELFNLQSLNSLLFQYTRNIKSVPDEIRKLTKLTHFDFWSAQLDYVSPELFKLPELKRANFAYSRYTPTKETEEALQDWLNRAEKPTFRSWNK